jgi:hypothetical protein
MYYIKMSQGPNTRNQTATKEQMSAADKAAAAAVRKAVKDAMKGSGNDNTANYLRRSRVSENKNRRQSARRSIRRGGAPPQAPAPPPAPVAAPAADVTGRDGSLCLGLKSEKTCTPNAAMRKICQWMPNAKPVPRCQRKADTTNLSRESRLRLHEIDQKQKETLGEGWSTIDEESEVYVPSSRASQDSEFSDDSQVSQDDEEQNAFVAPVRAAPARAAPARAAPARAAAPVRAAVAPRVPKLNPNRPLGCVQRVSQVNTKTRGSYPRTACYDSRDPAVNDAANCFINPETNKCKNVVRR